MMNATAGFQIVSPADHRPGEPDAAGNDLSPCIVSGTQAVSDAPPQPLGRVPYITLQAFSETPGFAASVDQAARDRRLSRADVTVSSGGLRGAVDVFAQATTPDLLMIETGLHGEALFRQLDALAEVCDANSKVVLVGGVNDVSLYRQLLERGIADYLVAPAGALSLIDVVLRLFPQDETARLGKVVAFVGAKGGAGSSTVAQNTAWSLAKSGAKVLLADLDVQFGTAALSYNIDAPVGFAEQLAGAERLDDALFERLLHKHGPNLSVLAGATASRDVVPPSLEVLDRIVDRARATFPFVILDLPHEWTPWVRQALISADEVVVTAEPDLANLRNARRVFDLLKATRLNDADPLLVLNRVGVPRRDEIKAEDFATTLETQLRAKLAFAPKAFGKAASSGRMIAEISTTIGQPFTQLAQILSGKAPPRQARRFLGWRRAHEQV
ncbi:CtpF protein [Paracoccus liaowanqingii]|uniref:CtpF protein n=1 Tax=Paracoccus liaowanqingii TaxID=2560053 RepID=A0A4Z1BMN1_9RHOB|nr:AAA family ATPase [Paracoccus liaowanqingii]TGN62501.1 CtpF protein [Paracoccus liaowanqingii]